MSTANKKLPILKLGPVQQKILLLLASGVTLAFTHSPAEYRRLLAGIRKHWQEINEYSIKRSIKKLYESKLISEKHNKDGTITIEVTEKGKRRALEYSFDTIEIPKSKEWNGKWFMVMFDIPEDSKNLRDSIRYQLKRLGFYEFQKSVFIFPYQGKDEIDFIIDYYNARAFVRTLTVESLDNESHLKHIFSL